MYFHKGLLLATCSIAVAAAQEQPKPQLTARELFYSGVQTKPATPATPLTPQSKATPPARADKAVVKEATGTGPKAAAPTAAGSNSSAAPATRPQNSELAGGARIVPAAATTSGPPLGLKYTILKYAGNQEVEVPADTVFHAGDRIQLNVQTNVPGYLYIISRGSSGTWKPMFPSPDVEDGSNHVDGFHSYTLPPKSRIVFDEQNGNEKLFIVFSREQETDLEKMIYSLQTGQPGATPTKQESAPKKTDSGTTLLVMANTKIDDAMVGRLRTVYARDLVIEKVDEKTPEAAGTKKETAVYVVNRSGSPDSRLVADLELVHR